MDGVFQAGIVDLKNKLFAITVGVFTSVLPINSASASGGFWCTGMQDSDVYVHVPTGRLPFLSVLDARIEAQGRYWATRDAVFPEDVPAYTEIIVGQAFRGNGRISIDFADSNAEAILAQLRLLGHYDQGSGSASTAGLLIIPEQAAYAVSCDHD